MYVDEGYSKQNGKIYTRTLLRESYREKGKVKHRTIANISKCSPEEIAAIKLALKHKDNLKSLVSVKEELKTKNGPSVGAVWLLDALSKRLHIKKALGNTRKGKLAFWMVIARIIDQGSRLSAVRLARSHAACDILKLETFNEDSLYETLDWLDKNQLKIEKKLFSLRNRAGKPKLFLYDVTSSYLEGTENELGDWGYNRDGKKGKKIIVYGLLADEDGTPISIQAFKGNTSDNQTLLAQIKKAAGDFGAEDVTFVGDRGMIKSAQVEQLSEENFHYITAITKPQIESLVKENIIQLELFDEKIVQVEADDIRYILRRNAIRAYEMADSRDSRLYSLAEFIAEKNKYLKAHKKAKLEVALRDARDKSKRLKLSKFVQVYAQGVERRLTMRIDEVKKAFECRFDGCYVIKTDLKKETASARKVHDRYKDLTLVEWAFRTCKSVHLEARPIYVQKASRTRGHLFVVMLAYMIIKHLSEIWARFDLTVEEGIENLCKITSIEFRIRKMRFWQVPEPDDGNAELLSAAEVKLPSYIHHRGVKVYTRVKLNELKN